MQKPWRNLYKYAFIESRMLCNFLIAVIQTAVHQTVLFDI